MQSLKCIFSFVLAGLLLTSTIGFSVSRHYCMGMLKQERFFSIAESCDHENEQSKNTQQIQKSCCEDELILVNGLEVVSSSAKNLFLKIQFNWSEKSKVAEYQITVFPEKDNTLRPNSKAPPQKGYSLFLEQERFLI